MLATVAFALDARRQPRRRVAHGYKKSCRTDLFLGIAKHKSRHPVEQDGRWRRVARQGTPKVAVYALISRCARVPCRRLGQGGGVLRCAPFLVTHTCMHRTRKPRKKVCA